MQPVHPVHRKHTITYVTNEECLKTRPVLMRANGELKPQRFRSTTIMRTRIPTQVCNSSPATVRKVKECSYSSAFDVSQSRYDCLNDPRMSSGPLHSRDSLVETRANITRKTAPEYIFSGLPYLKNSLGFLDRPLKEYRRLKNAISIECAPLRLVEDWENKQGR